MSRTSRAETSSSVGDLLRRGLPAERLHELALDVHDLVELLHHVDGDADRPALVGDGARDGLPDPPGGVRRELVATAVVELLHRADEPERALLDEVQERQPAAQVALGDGHDEPQVGLDHLLLGLHVAALDALGERHLLLGGEQGDAADRPQVEPQGVQRRLDREVDRRLLGLVDLLLLAARLRGGLQLGPLVRHGLAVRGDDLDAVLLQVGVQLADLLLRDVDLLQGRGDLLDRQNPLLLSLGDQRPQLVHLDDGCLVRQQCFLLLTQARPSLG